MKPVSRRAAPNPTESDQSDQSRQIQANPGKSKQIQANPKWNAVVLELVGDLILPNRKVSLEDRELAGDVIRVDALGLKIKIRLPECPGGEDWIHGQAVVENSCLAAERWGGGR